MSWFQRLANTVRARALSRNLDREVAFHLAERADELAARGMTADEASLEARRRFGNRTVQTERTHDRDVLLWLESLFADIRYAARALVANPGFAAVAILSLALGLGANTAIFTLANAVVLRSLPVRDPQDLVLLDIRDAKHASERAIRTSPIRSGRRFETTPTSSPARSRTPTGCSTWRTAASCGMRLAPS